MAAQDRPNMISITPPTEILDDVHFPVDVDPGWYPGQPEVEEPETPKDQVPTVLTKLQKWGDYASYGEPVAPTRFVPMKTPLSRAILADWQLPSAPRHSLTVPGLLGAQSAAGRNVGLILDLANHECLYTDDLPPGVRYRHIRFVAKELPPRSFVAEVAAAAAEFWSEQPDQFIAIHCAYGFNRTGFVVCSFLIEHCGLSVDEALASFAASRPPGVKHERFRVELHRRYGAGAGGREQRGSDAGGRAGSSDDTARRGGAGECGGAAADGAGVTGDSDAGDDDEGDGGGSGGGGSCSGLCSAVSEGNSSIACSPDTASGLDRVIGLSASPSSGCSLPSAALGMQGHRPTCGSPLSLPPAPRPCGTAAPALHCPPGSTASMGEAGDGWRAGDSAPPGQLGGSKGCCGDGQLGSGAAAAAPAAAALHRGASSGGSGSDDELGSRFVIGNDSFGPITTAELHAQLKALQL